MENLATETEELIKETAKRLFFAEGKIYATTQDIANAAGITRTSIHYYFRSRKQLFDKVFLEATVEMRLKMQKMYQQDLPFRLKTEAVIDCFLEKSLAQPFLELFIIAEFNNDSKVSEIFIPLENQKERLTLLQNAIDEEVAAGTMKPIPALQFIITLLSLCTYPFLAQPLIRNVMNLDKDAYLKMISQRKKFILQLLFLDQ